MLTELPTIYHAGGERVRKVIEKTGGIVEERVYLGDFEVYRKSVAGTLDFERETLHISDNEKKIVSIETKTKENATSIQTPAPSIRYQYDNHLGSSTLELDHTAALISYEEYHPFGTTSYRSGSTENEVSMKRYKYVGKERDEETGLYYYGARYYAAWLCRFVSVDPLAGKFPNSSPYHYSNNNPIRYSDPTGMEGKDEVDQVHTVQKGETLWSIAKSNNTTADALRITNNLNPENDTKLQIGTNLTISSSSNSQGSQENNPDKGSNLTNIIPFESVSDNTSVSKEPVNFELHNPDKKIIFRPISSDVPQQTISPKNPLGHPESFLEQNNISYTNQNKIEKAKNEMRQRDPHCFGGPNTGTGLVPNLYEGIKQAPSIAFQGLILSKIPMMKFNRFSTLTKGLFSGSRHNQLRGSAYRIFKKTNSIVNKGQDIIEPGLDIYYKSKDLNNIYNNIIFNDSTFKYNEN